LFQLLGEHFDVAAIKVEDRLIAQQIHVGSSGVEKDLLFSDAQCLARAHHLAFRLPRAIGGLKSVESVCVAVAPNCRVPRSSPMLL
jgi:hypothetical protein